MLDGSPLNSGAGWFIAYSNDLLDWIIDDRHRIFFETGENAAAISL